MLFPFIFIFCNYELFPLIFSLFFVTRYLYICAWLDYFERVIWVRLNYNATSKAPTIQKLYIHIQYNLNLVLFYTLSPKYSHPYSLVFLFSLYYILSFWDRYSVDFLGNLTPWKSREISTLGRSELVDQLLFATTSTPRISRSRSRISRSTWSASSGPPGTAWKAIDAGFFILGSAAMISPLSLISKATPRYI